MHNISKFERVTLFKQYDEGTAIQKHSKQLKKMIDMHGLFWVKWC